MRPSIRNRELACHDGFIRLNAYGKTYKLRAYDPRRRSRTRTWRMRERRKQRVRRANMRQVIQRIEIDAVAAALEQAVLEGKIQRAPNGAYQALPAKAIANANQRKIAFQRMWLNGDPRTTIAEELETTVNTLSTLKARMRAEGWDVASRPPGGLNPKPQTVCVIQPRKADSPSHRPVS